MKNYLKKFFMSILIFTLISPSFFAQNTNTNPLGLIYKIILNVDYLAAGEGNMWEDAVKGAPLYNQDRVKTDVRSIAILKFLDGSVLKVRPETEVTIFGEQLADNSLKKEANISSGEILFDVPTEENQRFTFTTPTGLASIRGTKGYFEVKLEETIIALEEGIMEVEGKSGLKENATLETGKTAFISQNGSVVIVPTPAEILSKMKKANIDKLNKYIIDTNEGMYEMEILQEEK
jgi:hypothetical protein